MTCSESVWSFGKCQFLVWHNIRWNGQHYKHEGSLQKWSYSTKWYTTITIVCNSQVQNTKRIIWTPKPPPPQCPSEQMFSNWVTKLRTVTCCTIFFLILVLKPTTELFKNRLQVALKDGLVTPRGIYDRPHLENTAQQIGAVF